MNANGVKVFHVTYGHAVAVFVTNDLVLDFFPARDAALNEYLIHAAAVQAHRSNGAKLFFVVCNAAAAAAQRICRANDHRVANALRNRNTFFYTFCNGTFGAGLLDAGHGLFKQLSILCHADGVGIGANHAHILLCQKSGFF